MLTVAQITDLHICSDRHPENRDRAEARLRQVLRAIMAARPRPVAIIASGDLVDAGEVEAYQALWRIFAEETDLPIYPAVGNHDHRENLIKSSDWPESRLHDGFVQYTADVAEDLRLVVCDTLEQGHSGGGFCRARAAWLKQTLDQEPDRPTLVVLHHPPIASGIPWMDPKPGEPWIARLVAALEGQHQVRVVMCGHVHRAFTRALAGRTITVAPATDIQLTLDLSPIDMTRPDGREILLAEPPGYALHMWDNGEITTHFCVAGPYPTAARYEHRFKKDLGRTGMTG
jgi:3',5'-cyclic AMP phosphodiesterase CpdA